MAVSSRDWYQENRSSIVTNWRRWRRWETVVLKDLDIFKALDNMLLWGGVILFSFLYSLAQKLEKVPIYCW